ncbi:unnamed protein product [Hydatigera taeniaeformis]|uniref:PH domain-containing protein n=1 Tax=Hydatigena taeniaeformis TaxID=6205 RepID=A0A0R3X163_HYDTA|nr:unnamed protein product [Hydatigera taeniaeformis]
MKGFQYRWVVVESTNGVLEYYEREEHKKFQKPRSSVSLVFATVCPSDEDSQTFIVNTSQGENLRFKGELPKLILRRSFQGVAPLSVGLAGLPSPVQRPSLLPVKEARPVMLNSSNSGRYLAPLLSHPLFKLPCDSHTRTRGYGVDASCNSRKRGVNVARLEHKHTIFNKSEYLKSTSRSEATALSAVELDAVLIENLPWMPLLLIRMLLPFASSLSSEVNLNANDAPALVDPYHQLNELFRLLEREGNLLGRDIDDLYNQPTVAFANRSPEVTELYRNLLIIKATSQASIKSLKQCLGGLQRDNSNVSLDVGLL